MDLYCAKYPPPEAIDISETHHHRLTLLKEVIEFECDAKCGIDGYGFPYKFHECDLAFHVDCVWHPSKLKYPLEGDRSPYKCCQCDFMIHKDCLALPRLININRHDHRVSRTSLVGVVNSVCGVCHQKVDWTWGGYSCQRCPSYIVHSKCATREDVWNGKELEGVLEETEDVEPYVVIDENTIQHFSHTEHYLRLHVYGVLCDENKRCSACTHPICLQSFYGCMDCDFILHQNCAGFLRKKWHVLHNERLTLVTNEADSFFCDACYRISNGFRYQNDGRNFDVLCTSISEPFIHPSHPYHPLYYNSTEEDKFCNGCNRVEYRMLGCIENGCNFFICFGCATLPQVVKHRVDDHPLSLCYGEKARGKYWCDICEKETNPETWFYTCKDHRASLHKECVLGEFSGLMPGSTVKDSIGSYENRTPTKGNCSISSKSAGNVIVSSEPVNVIGMLHVLL
ncbi:unnamed protein product [Arabidopsis lyrata]|nr:unnamed protein product [Arabidopsis lyrata]